MRQMFLDIDGVLADFDRGYREYYDCFAGIEYEDVTSWEFCVEHYKKMTGKSAASFWGGFTHEFWANLHKTPECDLILALTEPYKPILLTAPPLSGDGSSAGGKQEWIRKNLPDYFFDGRYLIGACKEICAKPGAILIDDSDANCIAWIENGGTAILVPRPWNVLREYPVVQTIQENLIAVLDSDY